MYALGVLLLLGGLWSMLSVETKEERFVYFAVIVIGGALILK